MPARKGTTKKPDKHKMPGMPMHEDTEMPKSPRMPGTHPMKGPMTTPRRKSPSKRSY